MPVNWFKCPKCGEEFRTKNEKPMHCDTEATKLLRVPNIIMREPSDKYRGISQIKDQQKILKQRSREHSRNTEMNELVENNPMDEAIKNGWIREDGSVRKKIDDK